jgi:hypothetical protein
MKPNLHFSATKALLCEMLLQCGLEPSEINGACLVEIGVSYLNAVGVDEQATKDLLSTVTKHYYKEKAS